MQIESGVGSAQHQLILNPAVEENGNHRWTRMNTDLVRKTIHPLRGGEGMGVRTLRRGKVGERAGESRRGSQTEPGVRPAQHQMIVQQLKIQARGRMLGVHALA